MPVEVESHRSAADHRSVAAVELHLKFAVRQQAEAKAHSQE